MKLRGRTTRGKYGLLLKRHGVPRSALREAKRLRIPLSRALAHVEHSEASSRKEIRAVLEAMPPEDKYLRALMTAWHCRLKAVVPTHQD